MSVEISSGYICKLSELLGTTEPALRLLLSVLAGYPLAVIYTKAVRRHKSLFLHHVYFIVTGFILGFFNYGFDTMHSVFAISYTYLIMRFLGGTAVSLVSVFVLNMLHLLCGYYFSGTDKYDINWTMPQCVLVLRLIGLAFDYYDGQQPPECLSAENKKLALKDLPDPVETFAYALFPASCMVGPQFPMKRYHDYVRREFDRQILTRHHFKPDEVPSKTKIEKLLEEDNEIPAGNVIAALKRFGLGLGYLVTFQLLGLLVSDDYMSSDEFGQLSLFRRILLLGIWGRFSLYKYISCWLLTEGACILFGVTFNGMDEEGQPKWDGVSNVTLKVFENSTEFNHYIQSFNTNTNHWVAHYIYKRLKFLGNRHLSQLGALLFLAIWHGFHSGYYVCFLFEFIVIYMERDFKSIVDGNVTLRNFFASDVAKAVCKLLLRIYTFVFMGWCLLPFVLLKFDKYWKAFGNVDYIGIILFVFWPIFYAPLMRIMFRKTKHIETDKTD